MRHGHACGAINFRQTLITVFEILVKEFFFIKMHKIALLIEKMKQRCSMWGHWSYSIENQTKFNINKWKIKLNAYLHETGNGRTCDL